MNTSNTSKDSYDLFMGALDVTNQALDKLRDTPLFASLIKLMENQAAGRKFGVAIYSDEPDQPHDYYTVRANNHKIELVARGKDAPDIDWKVSRAYLQDLNDHPEDYIESPWKLDVEWLKHRLQDAA